MKKSELQQLIREEIKNILTEDTLDSYSKNVLAKMKELAIKMKEPFDDDYLEWYSKDESFKKMISIAKMNHSSVTSAAKTIMSTFY